VNVKYGYGLARSELPSAQLPQSSMVYPYSMGPLSHPLPFSVKHCSGNPIYLFPEMKLHSLVPNSYVHVSVMDLYIPMISLLIWLQQNRQTNPKKL
jgi:hypothetical protein